MTQTGPGTSLLDHFSALTDPRQVAKVLYPVAGDPAPGAGRDPGRRRRLRRGAGLGRGAAGLPAPLPALRHGIPSHDTLNDVVNALDPELFKRCFVDLGRRPARPTQPEFVAIDGKTSRRSHARAKGREPLHLVSGLGRAGQRLVLGQEAVAGKSNEITAIPLLLERLELTGALVTIDAIGCQTKIAQAILAKRRRLPPGGEDQLARAACRDRALLRGRAGRGFRPAGDHRRRPRPDRDPPPRW